MFKAQLFVTENTREQVGDGAHVTLIGRGKGLPPGVQEVRVSMSINDEDVVQRVPYEDRERYPVELIVTPLDDALPGTAGDKLIARAKGARLTDNDRHAPGQGGRVVLVAQVADGSFRDAPIPSVTVLIVYRDNALMEAWPLRREDRKSERFTLSLIQRAETQPERSADAAEITITEDAA